jgi:hypothetical protein
MTNLKNLSTSPTPCLILHPVDLKPKRNLVDWTLAITRNREALIRIIAALMALGGLGRGNTLLPRPIYRAILLVLRPAESAARRLIILAALGLSKNFGDSLLNSTTTGTSKEQWWKVLSKLSPKFSRFRLIDPLKRFAPMTTPDEDSWDSDIEDEDNANLDPCDTGSDEAALPRISLPGHFDPVFVTPSAASLADMMDAKHIARRLEALLRALQNLPREARRLARWQARRPLILSQNKPTRLSPLRPGRPPGFRLRVNHEIDGVLNECHALVLDRLTAPNSS